MFTGIVTSMGKIIKTTNKGDSKVFLVEPDIKNYFKGVKNGESIAINGACMTITSIKNNRFEFTTIKESLSKTNLGDLKIGNYVNLEHPMRLNATIDGHLVMGHVDSTGETVKVNRLKDSWEFYFKFNSKYKNNIIYVGSICINGISLTIANIEKENNKEITIKTAIIPHTFDVTNFKFLKPGDKVTALVKATEMMVIK